MFYRGKYGKNKPSPAQINFIEQMKKKGCYAGVAYTVNDAIMICEEIKQLRWCRSFGNIT
jgi:hypothetical protein